MKNLNKSMLTIGLIILSSIFIGFKIDPQGSDFEKFTGRWKLYQIQQQDTISQNWRNAKGHNRNREGFIIYDGLGGMGVHHVSENYMNYEFKGEGGLDSFTKEDLRHLANNFVYFGKYKVLEKNRIIEHHIESSNNPGRWGTIAKRKYQFKGDTLILSPLKTSSGIPARIIWLKLNDRN